MNAPFSQETRPGRLTTVLGPNVLVLTAFEGDERLNDLFDFSVECIAVTSGIDFDALIGTQAAVHIATLHGGEQTFGGVITQARWLGLSDHGDRFRLRLQPWLFLASLRRNQRIFHNKTVVQIIEDVLGAYADAGKVESRLTTDYPELEYTVQYRESDMAFATRQMERHGISYHFEHSSDGHLMILTDAATTHADIGARPYKPHSGHHQRDIGHIRTWHPSRRITTGAVRLTDYNFKKPTAAMEVDRVGDAGHPQGQIESYDFPGDYLDQGRGILVADLRTRSERGQSERFEAKGDVVSLRAGVRMTLEGDVVPGHGADYLCLSASHRFTANAYRTTAAASDDDAYEGQYLLMPADRPMVPERKTPLARVHGPQTGVVVGEGEIDCDEFGRILVHLHWDLDRAYTMRCRVSQSWAGKGWGGLVIPRIGMEVVVEFLEGDPDKPLVTGCVYNGKNDVPYALPQHKTRSTFKTDTHQGDGFNELRFEDEAGQEEIFVHAQKDKNTKVENNQTERVNVNKVESVGHNKASEVGNNLLQVVDGNMDVRVGPGNTGTITPTGADRLTQGIGVTGPRQGPAGSKPGSGTLTIAVEENKVQTIRGFHDEQVTKHKKIVTQTGEYALSAGTYAEIRAADYIELTCGSATIKLESNGTISINGVALLTSSSDKTHIKGTVVKIN